MCGRGSDEPRFGAMPFVDCAASDGGAGTRQVRKMPTHCVSIFGTYPCLPGTLAPRCQGKHPSLKHLRLAPRTSALVHVSGPGRPQRTARAHSHRGRPRRKDPDRDKCTEVHTIDKHRTWRGAASESRPASRVTTLLLSSHHIRLDPPSLLKSPRQSLVRRLALVPPLVVACKQFVRMPRRPQRRAHILIETRHYPTKAKAPQVLGVTQCELIELVTGDA